MCPVCLALLCGCAGIEHSTPQPRLWRASLLPAIAQDCLNTATQVTDLAKLPSSGSCEKIAGACGCVEFPLRKGAAPKARGLSGEAGKPREEPGAIRDTMR